MKYKGMLPDTFFEVEATDERDAQRKMLAKLRDETEEDEFIVWPADQYDPPEVKRS